MEKKYYFAYGSNMDISQMRVRCPGSEEMCAAKLRNYRFLINTKAAGYHTFPDAYIQELKIWESW